MEIERKFKLQRLPEHLEQFQALIIEQGYLCTKPVVRIRKSNNDYILTYKSKFLESETQESVAIQNNEVELPLTKESYEHLREKADNHIIQKTRYLIPIGDSLTAELDLFSGQLEGLYFVEVEFPDLQSASQFIPPEWFGEDVSLDKRYRNSYLSRLDSAKELL